MMVFLKDVLEILKPADKILQSREIGYADAVSVIQAVLDEIEEHRDKFDMLQTKVLRITSDAGIVPAINNRRRSVHEREAERADKIKSAYFKALDIIITEMNRRFHENNEILIALSTSRKMDLNLLKPLAQLNRIEMPSSSELEVARKYLESHWSSDDCQTDESNEKDVLKHLFPVRAAFPAVFKLFCAIESFPCSTTISECSFSCLARVGILGRVHMSNERLRNLTFLAFEQKQLANISAETILQYFNNMKNRRLQLY